MGTKRVELPEVGSKWVSLFDKPRMAGISKGDVVTIVYASECVDYTSLDGGNWTCRMDQWHNNFRPLETEKTPTELTEEVSLGYTPKNIKGKDNVNSPSHYGQGSIEAIEYIKDTLTTEEYIGYLRGNIAKYLHRWRYKNGLEDLQKAQVYLGWLIETIKEGT